MKTALAFGGARQHLPYLDQPFSIPARSTGDASLWSSRSGVILAGQSRRALHSGRTEPRTSRQFGKAVQGHSDHGRRQRYSTS